MSIYHTKAENEVLELKLKYALLLDNARDFAEYKRLELSLENQIKATLGVPLKPESQPNQLED
jgi:hypothetical protein